MGGDFRTALRVRKRQYSLRGRRAGEQIGEIQFSAWSVLFEIGPHWAGPAVSQVEVKVHQCLMQAKLALTFFSLLFFPFRLGRFDCAALSERELPATAGRVGGVKTLLPDPKPAQSQCLTKSVAARLELLHASVQTRVGWAREEALMSRRSEMLAHART